MRRTYLILCILLLSTYTFSQGQPITRDASYYKSKGYQVFEKYRLAIKVPCILEDAANKVAANFELHYGGFDQPFNASYGAFYQLIVRRTPASYSSLSISEKQKLQDETMLDGTRNVEVVYFKLEKGTIRSYLYEHQKNGIKAKSISFFYGDKIYAFNVMSNDQLTGRFNTLTNSIVFY